MGRTGLAVAGHQPEAPPEPGTSAEARRAGERQVAPGLGAAASAALLGWAGHGQSPVPGAAGCRCPSSTRSRSRTLLSQALGWVGAGHLWGSASALHRVLEECASLLAAFWSTVLPVSPAQRQGKVSTDRAGGCRGGADRARSSSRSSCPRSYRVRSRRCGSSSPRGRRLCRARPSNCAAQPSSRTAWSGSSSASVGGPAKLASSPRTSAGSTAVTSLTPFLSLSLSQ